jgi:hypothetical protein
MDPRSDEQLVAILAAFSLRARRILSHSLMDDVELLDHIASASLVVRRTDGQLGIERILPREEQLESLAARVRPLTLNDEAIYYNKVLNALNTLLIRADAAEHTDWTRNLKADWKSVDPASGKATYFHQTWSADTAPAEVNDATLALSWFYGDLVHADGKYEETKNAFAINDRFSAAAVRTAQLAIMTRDTYNWIEWLAEHGPLQPDVLGDVSISVKVEPSPTLQLIGIYAGEMGEHVAPGADPATAGLSTDAGPWNETAEDGRWTISIPWGAGTE